MSDAEKAELFKAFYAMNGDPIWTSKDGRKVRYSEMEDRHLKNCIGMIQRGTDWEGDRVGKKTTAKLARLQLELGFRESMA